MQIFKWMPLKAEEQSTQPETLVSPGVVEKGINDLGNNMQTNNIISNDNSTTESSNNSNNNNIKPTTNGTSHQVVQSTQGRNTINCSPDNNNIINNDNSTNEQSISTTNNQIARDAPERINSPPPKRVKTSSEPAIATPEEAHHPAVVATTRENQDEDVAMPVEDEEEQPQYNELRQVGRSTPLVTDLTSSCITPINSANEPVETAKLAENDKENYATAPNSITDSPTVPSSTEQPLNDIVMMEAESCPSKESRETENVEMEDYSSIARIVTEQIVNKVSHGF